MATAIPTTSPSDVPLSISMACEKFERGPATTRAVTFGTSPANGRFSEADRSASWRSASDCSMVVDSPSASCDWSRSFSLLQVLVVGDAVPRVATRAR